MAKTPEGHVKDAVIKLLRAQGAYYFFPVAGGYGKAGIPDIIACLRGRFIAIECKAGKNQPTLLQLREMQQIRDAGGAVFVINETNQAELAAYLQEVISGTTV